MTDTNTAATQGDPQAPANAAPAADDNKQTPPVSGVDLSFDTAAPSDDNKNKEPPRGEDGKDKKDDKEPSGKSPFEKTGDAGMDLALGWLSRLGYGSDDEVVKMAYEGDFRLLRAELSGREDAHGWQEYVAIAEQYQKDSVAKEATRLVDIEKTVHETAGGEKVWNDVFAWAKANADEKQKAAFNKFIVDGDPTTAAMCAEWLVNRYREATGTSFEPAKAVKDTPSDNTNAATYALDPRSYAAKVSELSQKIGSQNVNASPEYAELKKRRAAWRG